MKGGGGEFSTGTMGNFQPELTKERGSESGLTEGLRIKLAPRARFELATLRLTAECSTIELPGNRATHLFSF
jgi:hypothetical protein